MITRVLFAVLLFLAGLDAVEARVTRITIDKVESPAFGGQEFGHAGRYEKLIGRVFGEVDPRAPGNAGIVYLDKAPRNAAGRVVYSADVYILKPLDLSKGNRRMFYGVLNRGSKLDLVMLNNAPFGEHTNNPTTPADVGNGFLMRQGYTVVWSGWQARAGLAGAQCCIDPTPGLMGATLPTPVEGGKPIVGTARDLFVGRQQTTPPEHHTATLSYPAATQEVERIRVSARARAEGEPPQPIPPCRTGQKAIRCWSLDNEQTVRLSPGFESGLLYEFVYPAKNPLVLGLGFAITRDVVSFLRYQTADDAKTPNPLRLDGRETAIQKVLAHGISQSGRYLQEHVHGGFNQDEQERIVFDGVIADIAGAGKTFTNFLFGQPGRSQGAHQDYDFPENWFPFAYGALTDPLTAKRDGILRKGSGKTGDGFDPLVMVTNTATEYWRKSASLVHTDPGGEDVPIPDNVRVYFFASTQHFPLYASIATSLGARLPKGPCVHEQNPAFRGPGMRGLLVALGDWVSNGTPPPDSQIPTRSAGTLVPVEEGVTGFPQVPTAPHLGYANQTYARYGSVTARSAESRYVTLVPKTDSDGNDIAGIRLPDVTAPLGTHTGWAVRADVPGAMCGNLGQFIPFMWDKAARNLARDPRPSLRERYPTQKAYLTRIAQAAKDLQAQRLLLAEDVDTYVADAQRKVATIFTPPPKPKAEASPKKKKKGKKRARRR